MMTLLIPGLAFLLVITVKADCPNGYLRHDESCYAVTRVKATWAEAAVYCQKVGAQLVKVETAEENRFIQSLLRRESATIDSNGVWLGGFDFLAEGFWQWGFSTDPIDQMWWHPQQPDNQTGENCIMMYKDFNFDWDDIFCHRKGYFMCEVQPSVNPIIG